MSYTKLSEFMFEDFDNLALQVPGILIIGTCKKERKRIIRNIIVYSKVKSGVIISKEKDFYQLTSEVYKIHSTISENYHKCIIDSLYNEQIHYELPRQFLIVDDMLQRMHMNDANGSLGSIIKTHKCLNISPFILTTTITLRFNSDILQHFDFVILMHESCPHKLNEMYTDFGSMIFSMYDDYCEVMSEITKHNKNLLIALKSKTCFLLSTTSI